MSNFKAKQGASSSSDPIQAVQELSKAIQQPDTAIIIFFASSKYDLPVLGSALKNTFTCPVIGCTTSGEISSIKGYSEGGLAGVSFSSPELAVHPKLLTPLSKFGYLEGESLAQGIRSSLKLGNDFDPAHMFGVLLVDGLSMLEEQVIATLYKALGEISIVGGSAGDDLTFRDTHVYWEGEFLRDAAIIALFETTLPFRTFRIQHFEQTNTRLVITESDCVTRTVSEINGVRAAEGYAAAIGLKVSELSQHVLAENPTLLKIGGEYYVRAIQTVHPDGSLSFACAIDNGLVLTIGKGKGIIENLNENIDRLRRDIPTLSFVLGFDCIARRLELQSKGLIGEAEKVLKDINFIGFSTYGEQFNSVHVNQTMTGIAFG